MASVEPVSTVSTPAAPVLAVDETKTASVPSAVVETHPNHTVELRIVRPDQTLVLERKQTGVHVGGTPGTGKTELATKLLAYRDSVPRRGDMSKVAVIDTDHLVQPFWDQVHQLETERDEAMPQEELEKAWFRNLHPTLQRFFSTLPEGSLIICCGVCDNTVFPDDGKQTNREVDHPNATVRYLLPRVQWSQKLFMTVPLPQLLVQRFNRDVRKVVNDPVLSKSLVDPGSDGELHWSARTVRNEAAMDRRVYIDVLQYEPGTFDELFARLCGLVDLWLPPEAHETVATKKRKRE